MTLAANNSTMETSIKDVTCNTAGDALLGKIIKSYFSITKE